MVEKFDIRLMPNHSIENMRAVQINSMDAKIELKIKDKDPFFADAVLVATGSSPGGYKLAESMGHSISERAPSLFSFKIEDTLIKELPGLSFETSLTLTLPDKKMFKQNGPSLITHWGLSGPAILKLSAWAAREMKRSNYDAVLTVNWMGDLKLGDVEDLLQTIKTEDSKSFIRNAYPSTLPKRFWLSLLEKLQLDLDKQWANVSKKEFNLLAQALTTSQFKILGQNRFKDEFVECGGVSLTEIDFKTMQSKICPQLHFAGEILDVDGITGGFNFQNAWTTGWIAAQDMVKQLSSP
jgi:predicted Rossmann fold flavoprotein